METKEGNELIAKYMDVVWYSNDRNGSYYIGKNVPYPFVTSLGYHASWEWIMPVIDKINGLGKEYSIAIFKTYISCTVEKGGKVYKDFSFAHSEYITATQTGKQAAFKLLIKFIIWHNENILVNNLVDIQ